MDDAFTPSTPGPRGAAFSAPELLAASRLTGADVAFLQLVRALSLKLTGAPRVSDPEARRRLDLVQAEFRAACASIIEKHLGLCQAGQALKALESAPLQRYLAARQAMAPALRSAASQLEQRMGQVEL